MHSSLSIFATLLASVVTAILQSPNTVILNDYGHSPPVYPSPKTTGIGWEDAMVKAKSFIAQLTVQEKVWLVTGAPGPCVGNIAPIPRIGFPGMCLQDGPLGIRAVDFASVFPAGITVAASWDRRLMYERGLAMGSEFKAKGAHVGLGPVASPLGRNPIGGRNWEGFAADPFLTGIAMEQTIIGMQDSGVQACAKHIIGYEQESARVATYTETGGTTVVVAPYSSNINDRTMHELYLWPFYNAVRAGVASVMCSYNRVNGSQACQNSKALNGLLKQELGFQGYVVSDWGGTYSGVASIEAGLDMDQPGGMGLYGGHKIPLSHFGDNVTSAINNGTLEMTRLDDMITRIMTPYYFLRQDEDFPSIDPSGGYIYKYVEDGWQSGWNLSAPSNRDVRADHHIAIRKLGAAGAVLLKNVNNALPLKKLKTLGVFGNAAADDTQGFTNEHCFENGALAVGGGSGSGTFTYLVTPLDALKQRNPTAFIQFVLNNTLLATTNLSTLIVPTIIPDVCLVFLKAFAAEGADRTSLDLDSNATAVVENVAAFCNNTIVVAHTMGPTLLPFADHPNVTAILLGHYPGQELGNALVDILYGDSNPSGKLPYTIAHKESDYSGAPTTAVNSTDEYAWQAYFEEELEIDYRFFDAKNISVQYEFGFGLSYTTFAFSNMSISNVNTSLISPAPPEQSVNTPGGNPALWDVLFNVTFSLTNTGSVAGAEVVQLYVGFPDSTPSGTPPKQLRGFEKVFLEAGATEVVTLELMRRDMSFWDVVSQKWAIPSGDFVVSVGSSSRDLKLVGSVMVV
ncbi:hypothetical protein EG328_002550 [Venturia inaequalis]|uniref:Probable beta-glucosidase G n=1 Tax=Venturia inaequalis TaxID=5025 RepID=A0A8H3UU10_VENIN|nr:hypothetical protein EG328_002550 [Venturia inaequalis]